MKSTTHSYFVIQRKDGNDRRADWHDNGFPDHHKGEMLDHLKELRREQKLFPKARAKQFRLISRKIKTTETKVA